MASIKCMNSPVYLGLLLHFLSTPMAYQPFKSQNVVFMTFGKVGSFGQVT